MKPTFSSWEEQDAYYASLGRRLPLSKIPTWDGPAWGRVEYEMRPPICIAIQHKNWRLVEKFWTKYKWMTEQAVRGK
jgi:hypothetical protein